MRRLVPIALILIAALLLIGGGTAVLRSAFQDKSEPPISDQSSAPSEAPGSNSPSSPNTNLESKSAKGSPLYITTTPPSPFATGSPVTFSLTATGGTRPYTWSATGGTLPRGLDFDPITATISGTPTTAETKKIRVRATGTEGQSDTIELRLETLGKTVTGISETKAIDSSPEESAFSLFADLADGSQASPYEAAFEAADGTPPYSFSATGLPEGILLDPATGILTGTPILGGLSQIEASATDASGETATAKVELFVEALPLQILTPAEIATASPGDTISEPLVAIGGYPPYTWAAAPAGDLSIVATASVLTGTAPEEPGLYPVTLAVSDQTGEAIAGATSVSVELGELEITTPEELPRARTEEPLELTLEATGGVPPLTWSSAFTFPEEIALTPGGDLTGTPEDAYDFSFEATVTSASGETASRTFTLRTAPAVAPARDLQAFPSDQKAAFTWTLPDDPSLAEVVLVANAASPPTAPEDGNILYRGTANNHLATGLPENAQLHIAIFALDEEGDFSEPPSDAFAQLTLLPFTLAKADGSTNADPHADGIADYSPLSSNAFGSHDLSRVLGPPDGPPSFRRRRSHPSSFPRSNPGQRRQHHPFLRKQHHHQRTRSRLHRFRKCLRRLRYEQQRIHRTLNRLREPGWNHLPHDPLRLRPPLSSPME